MARISMQEFQWIFWESTYHRLCISLQSYLGERYCITVRACSDIIWANEGERAVPQIFWENGVPPRSPSTTPLQRSFAFYGATVCNGLQNSNDKHPVLLSPFCNSRGSKNRGERGFHRGSGLRSPSVGSCGKAPVWGRKRESPGRNAFWCICALCDILVKSAV